jgi:hypothetical protein
LVPVVFGLMQPALLGAFLVGRAAKRIDMVFTKADYDQQQFGKDRYECMVKHDSEQKFQSCLEAKGYTRTK